MLWYLKPDPQKKVIYRKAPVYFRIHFLLLMLPNQPTFSHSIMQTSQFNRRNSCTTLISLTRILYPNRFVPRIDTSLKRERRDHCSMHNFIARYIRWKKNCHFSLSIPTLIKWKHIKLQNNTILIVSFCREYAIPGTVLLFTPCSIDTCYNSHYTDKLKPWWSLS